MANKLLLGSGTWHWDGWVTVDADPENHPDVLTQFPPLPKVITERQWDIIMIIHAIEHVAPWKATELLKQCHDCLADKGVLVLEQPNILYAAKVLLGIVSPPNGEPGQFDMWPLYGDPTSRNEWMLHRWGYHPDSLMRALIDAGFSGDSIALKAAQYHQPTRDFRLEAIRHC